MRKKPILSAQKIAAFSHKNWLTVALCAMLSWSILGVPQNGYAQTDTSPEELLKALKKQEAKSSGGLDPTDMIGLNASLLKMQTFTTGVTSLESNFKGTMQQLMSAQ